MKVHSLVIPAPLRTFPASLFMVLSLVSLQAETIPFTGIGASETSGDGFAFSMPNFDGIDVNSDGSVNYNPLTYPPLPFDPAHPSIPPASDAPFDFGSLTYDESAITGNGTETLPVTPDMFLFDFNDYALALAIEVDVRPPESSSADVTLKDITGPGLTFRKGSVISLDFTATVEWRPKINGNPLIFMPYTGTLTVTEGTFTFDLSDGPQNWLGFGTNIEMEFDLVAKPDAFDQSANSFLSETHFLRKVDSFILSWASIPGKTYQIQTSANLKQESWQLYQTITADLEESTIELPKTSGPFFRIAVQR